MWPNEALRDRVADLVETFDVSHNWALSTMAVEILHAAGRIETMRTVEQLSDELHEILASPDDPDRQQQAYGAFISQFEDDVVGPYFEAVEALDPESRRTLLYMAAAASDNSYALPLILGELIATAAPPQLERALRRHAARFPEDRTMVNDAVDTYVTAVRGWAQLHDHLPDPPVPPSVDERAWRLLGELILYDARGGDARGAEPTRIWAAMRDECPGAVIGVLEDLGHSSLWNNAEPAPLAGLLSRYGDEIASIALWSLTHRDVLTSIFGPFRQPPEMLIFGILGSCSNPDVIGVIEPYVDDPTLGRWAVTAIQEIRARADRTGC
jgi:hypothetical protein